MASVTSTEGTIEQLLTAEPYEFFAVANGMRMPLRINATYASDAEASLVAIALSTRVIAIEVLQRGKLIFRAPKRDPRVVPTLDPDTPVAGHA